MANIKGNGTTIGKFLLIMFAGKTLAILAAKGINLPVNEVELAGYLGIILGFIYSVLDSYFKNNYKWTTFKKLLSIFNKEIEEEETIEENSIGENESEDTEDPTIEQEPEDVVGEDDGC